MKIVVRMNFQYIWKRTSIISPSDSRAVETNLNSKFIENDLLASQLFYQGLIYYRGSPEILNGIFTRPKHTRI